MAECSCKKQQLCGDSTSMATVVGIQAAKLFINNVLIKHERTPYTEEVLGIKMEELCLIQVSPNNIMG